MPKLSCGKLGGLCGEITFQPFFYATRFRVPFIRHRSSVTRRRPPEIKAAKPLSKVYGRRGRRRRVFNHSTPSSVARASTEAGTGSRKRETAVSASETEPR